jgi:hypothetical protein
MRRRVRPDNGLLHASRFEEPPHRLKPELPVAKRMCGVRRLRRRFGTFAVRTGKRCRAIACHSTPNFG